MTQCTTLAARRAGRRTVRLLALLPALGPALGLALAAAPAGAELAEIRWDAAGRFEQVFDLAPGAVGEACGRLQRGQAVDWRFEADAPADFNIHHHEGAKLVYTVRRRGVAADSGRFTAPAPQSYCWMWRNRGAQPLLLSLRMALQAPP